MDDIYEANWEQQEDNFRLTSPLHFEVKADGKCRITSADKKLDQTFDSTDEATEAINALLQRGMQQTS